MTSGATETTPESGRGAHLDGVHLRLELLATVLLAIAAVATAWSSYQSARWSGVQAIDFSKANAARVESTRASTEAGQLREVDVLTFTQWANAYAGGDHLLERFYYDRFRDEFKPAVKAWIKTRPLKSPDAPSTPFVMPQYKIAEDGEAKSLVADAEAASADAVRSNQRSDNYVLAVVLFAAALFFAGISTKLNARNQRLAVLAFGYMIFIGTVAWVVTFPVSISV